MSARVDLNYGKLRNIKNYLCRAGFFPPEQFQGLVAWRGVAIGSSGVNNCEKGVAGGGRRARETSLRLL
ncbi:hypothetical protein ACFX1X_032612 [Malus domestica]